MQVLLENLADTPPDQIRANQILRASFYDLPFRLNVGETYSISERERALPRLHLLNEIAFAAGTDVDATNRYFVGKATEFVNRWKARVDEREYIRQLQLHHVETAARVDTSALVVFRSSDEDALQAIGANETPSPLFGGAEWDGFTFLNRFITSYTIVSSRPMIGPPPSLPRHLTHMDHMGVLKFQAIIITPDGDMTDGDAIRLLRKYRERAVNTRLLDGIPIHDMNTLPDDKLDELSRMLVHVGADAFYELWVHAKTAKLRGEMVQGLVLSCAALEGVHGAFTRLAFAKAARANSVGPDRDGADENQFDMAARKTISEAMREHGFSSFLQLTSMLFLRREEQPTQDEMAACLRAIQLRNAVMHATVKPKTGAYKMQEHTNKVYNEANKALGRMYTIYEAAWRRLRDS